MRKEKSRSPPKLSNGRLPLILACLPSCAKGRALHGIAETATKETLVRKLIRCGARAGQIADDLDSWGLEEDMVINGLNSEQQTQLSDALDKLDELWKKNFG